MFKGKNVNVDQNVVETVIGESVVIEGKVKSNTSIQIEGQVIGEVEAGGNVVVGNKGRVNANISAKEITIAGLVNGNVNASEKLIIKSNGKLIGEITSKAFIVDEGGKFLGRSHMKTEQQAKVEQKENFMQANKEDREEELADNDKAED